VLDRELLEELGRFSTPSVLNGLKRLGLQPKDMQTTDRHAVRCMSPALGPRLGFAVTRRLATRRGDVRTAAAASSPSGRAQQEDGYRVPEPRFLVVENVGEWQGPVCIWGELGANMNLAMGFVAGITNGPVRDLPEMEAAGFLTFAGGVDVGGGFVDAIDFGTPVTIGGVRFEQGDLLHGDVHGVVKIPVDLAPALPEAMRAHEAAERRVIEVCRSPGFSLDALDAAWGR
jgi:regulator of RNase E activity RraA